MSISLALEGVTSGYASSLVLRALSLKVAVGESLALLGKNGMGKSTLLKTVMGYLAKKAGTVSLGGHDVTALAPHRVARLGVAYAPQEHALFTELTVRDNLSIGLKSGVEFDDAFAAVESAFPVLKERLAQPAGTLSGGEQKMLLVSRALMMRPALMLLDEITEGVQPLVVERIAQVLCAERRARGTTLLMVEQNVPFALAAADRYAVLKQGEVVDEGTTRASNAQAVIFEHLRV